jgi:ParB family chromosome partitioning protein
VTRKNLFAHTADLAAAPRPGAERGIKPATPSGVALSPAQPKIKAIGSLGALLSDMTAESRSADELRRDLVNAPRVVLIEPDNIDPSPIRDRLDDPTSEDDRALLESISRDGQRVPALVRPNPKADGRYITVFGHRRIAAARKLEIPVRAVVVEMPEEDAFVAQGQENNARLNTSFIERAIFAKRLNDRGMRIVRIAAALNVVKSVVSESITVAETLPEPLLEAIGPAPSVGRARWQALAKRIGADADVWTKVVADPSFGNLPSDQRFDRVANPGTNGPSAKSPTESHDLVDDRGCYMKVRRTAKAMTYAIPYDRASDRTDGLAFADWMEKQIPSLREAYLKGR